MMKQVIFLLTCAELTAALLLAAVLFVFTLGKSPVFRVDRAGAAIIGSILMTGCGILSFEQAVQAIDHKTIAILFSMMVVVANLKAAGMFGYLGQLIARHIRSKAALLATVICAGGFLSAVAINDIVCLLFTPVVLLVCRQSGADPLPHLLGLAMASNIGSAATFLGNPQNILIGSLSQMPFFDYCRAAVPIAIAGLLLLYLLLRAAYKDRLSGALSFAETPHEIHFHRYLTRKTLTVLFCIIFFYALGFDLAAVSGFGAAFLLMTRRVKPNKIYASIDFNLLLIFVGLFILVGGIEASGLLRRLDAAIPPDLLRGLGSFGILAVALSNIVSNVPAVLLLQHYISDGSYIHWQALALYSTLAGNLTLFGSIANLIVAEIAKKQNVVISAGAYFRIGAPLTLILSLLTWLWLQA